MKPGLGSSLIICLLCTLTLVAAINRGNADSSIPVVPRRWYLTGSASQPTSLALDLSRPAGTTLETANINSTELEFSAPRILDNAPTVSSPMTLSLWLNVTKSTRISLIGVLHDYPGGKGQRLDLANYPVNETIGPGLSLNNFTFYWGQDLQLPTYADFSIGVKVNTSPNPNATFLWGSLARSSFTTLRMSGYESLSAANPQTNPFQILGGIPQRTTTSFDLNSTYPGNIVFFQASVTSSFGYTDIRRVNLTVTDPFSHIVKWEPMDLPQAQRPYVFTAIWAYNPNATAGTYQVSIAIIDQQNATAFSFNGVATFGLYRQTIFTRALNLIPYFGLGAGGLAVAAVAYRRNKTRKSYLVPFDFFNSLTGGELEGGSVVTVEGNTGSGKTLLTEQLMFEDLRKGRPCVFVSTSDFPSNVRSGMKSMGLDVSGYEQNGQLTFVDGYSSEAGQQSPEKLSIPALGDLTTVGMKITSSLPAESFKGGSLYFDSLTPLASKAKPESLVSFVQSVGARVKGMRGKAFFTVGPSVDGLVQKQLEEMADCVVQMEAFEESGVRKSRLRIAKLRARRHQQGWVIYTIEEGRGIIFYSKKARS